MYILYAHAHVLDIQLNIIIVLPHCVPVPPDPPIRIVLLVATP